MFYALPLIDSVSAGADDRQVSIYLFDLLPHIPPDTLTPDRNPFLSLPRTPYLRVGQPRKEFIIHKNQILPLTPDQKAQRSTSTSLGSRNLYFPGAHHLHHMMCVHSTSPGGTRLFMVCFLTILLIVPVCAVEYFEADMLAKFFYALVVIVAIITIVWVWQTVFARVRYRKEVR